MKKITGTLSRFFLLGVAAAAPLAATAQIDEVEQEDVPDPAITSVGGLLGIVDTVADWVFTLFTIIAVIFVLIAAWKFVTGGGDPEKMSEARQMLIYAAIGVGVALLAQGLQPILENFLGIGG